MYFFPLDLIRANALGSEARPGPRNKGALGSFAHPLPLFLSRWSQSGHLVWYSSATCVSIWSNERKSRIVTHKRLCVGVCSPLHTSTAFPWHLYQVVVKGSEPKASSSWFPSGCTAALPSSPHSPSLVPSRGLAAPSRAHRSTCGCLACFSASVITVSKDRPIADMEVH